jgi:photosystem II stability/assembly factor-like uncharacterized protein
MKKKLYLLLSFITVLFAQNINAQWASNKIGNLTNVTYASASTIIVIGDNNVVLRSADAGATWNQVNIATQTGIAKITFPTTTIGYALDNNLNLFKSINSGSTWTKVDSLKFPGYPNTMIFPSKDTGFIAAYQLLYRTTNGGATWDTCKKALASGDFTHLAYAGNKVVYAHNINCYYCTPPILLHSQDYGNTWDTACTFPIAYSDFVTSMQFLDKNVGFFAATNGYVYKTIDGGQNWNTSFLIGASDMKITILDASNIDVLASGIYIYKSVDGGNSYTSYTISSPTNAISYDKSSKITGVGSESIVQSADGGMTWTAIYSGTSSIQAICFKDASNGIAVNSSGQVSKTTNGGDEWVTITSDLPSQAFKIIYISGKYYAALYEGIYSSSNDGANWTIMPGSPINCFDVYFSSATLGAAGISGGSGYYSSGWTQNSSDEIRKFSFVNANIGFALGMTGGEVDDVFKTTDGGNSWTPLNTNSIYGNSIWFINKDTGFVCGFNGMIMRTRNGGILWDTLKTSIPSYISLYSMGFSDKNNGYVVGDYGFIAKTKDGGNTWSQISSPTGNTLNTIAYFNSVWYTGGSDGIYKLYNFITEDTVFINHASGSTASFQVSASSAWTLRADNPSLSLSATSGSSTQNITVTANKSLLNQYDSLEYIYGTMTLTGKVTHKVNIGPKILKHDILYVDYDTMDLNNTYSQDVYSTKPWTVSTTDPWFTVSKMGMGFMINRKPVNGPDVQQIGYVNINSSLGTKKIMVVYFPMDPPFMYVDKPTLKLPFSASADSFYLHSNFVCSITSDYPWLTVTPASGAGDVKIRFSAPLNSVNAQRLAIVVVSPVLAGGSGMGAYAMEGKGMPMILPQTIMVTQDANPGSTNCSHQAMIVNTGVPKLCVGDSVILSANSGVGFTYQWFADGAMVQGGTNNAYICRKPATYSVAVNYNNCTVISNPLTVEYYLPVIKPVVAVQSGTIKPCTGGSVVLHTAISYSAYLWNTDETTPTISISESGQYNVTVNDDNGCKAMSDDFEVNASEASTPAICVVNVDRADNKNVVVLKRAMDEKIKSFVVYKETTQAGDFIPVDTIDFDEYNFYIDQNSNPFVRSNRYRVSAIDSCDVESPMSIVHKTMHLTLNQRYGGGVNLIWENYEGLNFTSYSIYHGDSPTDMKLLTEVPSNIFTYSIVDGAKLYYQIAINLPESCELDKVLKAESGPYSQSLSNIAEFKGLLMGNTSITGVSAYPNPFTDMVNVQYTLTKASDVRIEILNAIGQKVADLKLDDQDAGQFMQTFAAKNLNMVPGLYTIRIIIGDEIETLKVISR